MLGFLKESAGGKGSAGRILSFLIVGAILFKVWTAPAGEIPDIPPTLALLAWGFYLVTRLDRETIKAVLMAYVGIMRGGAFKPPVKDIQ